MTRTQYETPEDEARQEVVQEKLRKYTGNEILTVPKSYHVDCCEATRYDHDLIGWWNVTGWWEIKCRDNSSSCYPTLMISLQKIMRGIEISNFTKLPFRLAIQYTDKLMIADVDKNIPIGYKWGGRTVKTRDPADIEPVIHIPMSHFKEIQMPVDIKSAPPPVEHQFLKDDIVW